MWFCNCRDRYVKKGRLEDVLALIQVLALHDNSHRSEEGLQNELPAQPASAESWLHLAKEHREFFRVDENRKLPIALVIRHVSSEQGTKRPPLSPDHTQALLATAIELHDRNIKRSQRWAVLIPIWVAVIRGLSLLLTAMLVEGA